VFAILYTYLSVVRCYHPLHAQVWGTADVCSLVVGSLLLSRGLVQASFRGENQFKRGVFEGVLSSR
jgi:hypothetical protein